MVACDKDMVSSILGVQVSSSPKKYLGLPMMVGRSQNRDFTHYVDRFRKRIESWNFLFLSMVGKETNQIGLTNTTGICNAMLPLS